MSTGSLRRSVFYSTSPARASIATVPRVAFQPLLPPRRHVTWDRRRWVFRTQTISHPRPDLQLALYSIRLPQWLHFLDCQRWAVGRHAGISTSHGPHWQEVPWAKVLGMPTRTAPSAEATFDGGDTPNPYLGKWTRVLLAGGPLAVLLLISLIAGSLVPLVGGQILILGLVLDTESYAAGLAKSTLASLCGLLALGTISVLAGATIPLAVTAGLVGLIVVLAALRVPDRRPLLGLTATAALLGPLLVVLATLFFRLAWGSTPSWIMSGDARNHYLITEWLGRDGWSLLDYPAFYNMLLPLVGFGDQGGPAGTALTKNVQVMSQAVLLGLILLGLIGGLLAAGTRLGRGAVLRATVGSIICAGPLLIGQTLWGGFQSVPFTVLAALCVIAALIAPCMRVAMAVVFTGLGTVLLLMLFPLAAPLAPAALLAWICVRYWRVSAGRIILLGALVLAFFGALSFVLLFISDSSLAPRLAANGWSQPWPWFLLLPVVLISIITWLVNRSREQWLPLLAIIFGVTATLLVVWTIVGIRNGLEGYYSQKLIWTVVIVLLPVSLTQLRSSQTSGSDPGSGDSILKSLAPSIGLVALVLGPLLLGTPQINNPITTFKQGRMLPTPAAVSLMVKAFDENSPSYFYGFRNVDDMRRLNIWSLAAVSNSPAGFNPETQWAYGASMVEPEPFCTQLTLEPDALVWATTGTKANVLETACPQYSDRIRVMPEAWEPSVLG
jgi:hypothetical protein